MWRGVGDCSEWDMLEKGVNREGGGRMEGGGDRW